MDVLILRLKGPLMSFGAPIVDEFGYIQPFPAQSMITGMVGNAMGVRRDQPERLELLQKALVFACREDTPGRKITDYQTVDLGQPHLLSTSKSTTTGWRTDGKNGGVSFRGGGSGTKTGTHIRYRDYWAGATYTVALAVKGDEFSVRQIAEAVQKPARPLFIGRKPCIPSRPIFQEVVRTEDNTLPGALIEALGQAEADDDAPPRDSYPCWWPATDAIDDVHRIEVTDRRDFYNDRHIGSRQLAHGFIPITHE